MLPKSIATLLKIPLFDIYLLSESTAATVLLERWYVRSESLGGLSLILQLRGYTDLDLWSSSAVTTSVHFYLGCCCFSWVLNYKNLHSLFVIFIVPFSDCVGEFLPIFININQVVKFIYMGLFKILIWKIHNILYLYFYFYW